MLLLLGFVVVVVFFFGFFGCCCCLNETRTLVKAGIRFMTVPCVLCTLCVMYPVCYRLTSHFINIDTMHGHGGFDGSKGKYVTVTVSKLIN